MKKAIFILSLLLTFFIVTAINGVSLLSSSLNIYGEQSNLIIDTTAPNISIELPIQDSEIGSTAVFQYQVNDTVGILRCNLSSSNIEGFTNGTALNVSNGEENNWVNETGKGAGYQISFSIRCTDLAGNTAISPQRTFRIAKTGQTATGSSGPDFLGETTKKTVCGGGEQEISYQNSTYCVTCDGEVVVTNGKFSCLENTQTETQAAATTVASSVKGTFILFLLTIVSYVLGGTDLVLKGKKEAKKRGR